MINKLLKTVCYLLILLPMCAYAGAIKVTNIQILKSVTSTRVIFSLNQPTENEVFTLDHPNRLVVDFDNASLTPQLRASLDKVNFGKSHIKAIRSGHPEEGILRLVFDLDMPINISRYPTTGEDLNFSRLIVDFSSVLLKANVAAVKQEHVPKEIESLLARHAARNPASSVSTTAKTVRYNRSEPPSIVAQLIKQAGFRPGYKAEPVARKVVLVEKKKIVEPALAETVSSPLPNPVETASRIQPTTVMPSIEKPPVIAALPRPAPRRFLVVVDAGHGGKDPGTIGRHGTKEKDVVLAIAVHLAALINSQPHMRAVLTRDGDYFVKLRERLSLAQEGKADLFVAIHADSFLDNKFKGVSVYALSPRGATSEAARWLAKRDNYSELGQVDFGELGDKSYQLRSVLIDLAQTATNKDSLRLGNKVLSSLGKVTRLRYVRVEQAPFVVLKSPAIPSILIETGFLSNPTEESRLSEKGYRHKLAQAILDGIHHYMESSVRQTSA
jgi:N-acetylmuramoyl-L-alanine amidase